MRSLDKHPWGLRVTFPVSLSSLSIKGVSDVGGFVEKLGIAAVIPGLEIEIPVAAWMLVRPFGEVGIGKSSDSSAEVFYGVGLRAHTTADRENIARHLWRHDFRTEDTGNRWYGRLIREV